MPAPAPTTQSSHYGNRSHKRVAAKALRTGLRCACHFFHVWELLWPIKLIIFVTPPVAGQFGGPVDCTVRLWPVAVKIAPVFLLAPVSTVMDACHSMRPLRSPLSTVCRACVCFALWPIFVIHRIQLDILVCQWTVHWHLAHGSLATALLTVPGVNCPDIRSGAPFAP